MPYQSEIVCKINDTLKQGALKDGVIEGIAYQVTRKTDAGDQLFPAVFNLGEIEKYIGLDDGSSSIIYHRLIRNTYRKNPSYDNRYIDTCQMLLVVYAKKSLVKMLPEQIEAFILEAFPDHYEHESVSNLPGVDNIRITINSSEMNPVSVFSGEYRNVPYRLSPDEIYFSVSYTMDISFDRTCLELCDFVQPPDTLCEFIELATAQQINDCLSESQRDNLEEIICGDATAVIKDQFGNTLDTEVIPCGASEDIVITLPRDIFIKFYFSMGDDETGILTVDADSAGTYTSSSQDGASGVITYNVNGGGFAAFINPTTLIAGNTIASKRTITAAAGYSKITGTY